MNGRENPEGKPPRRPVEEVVAEDADFPPRGAARGPMDLSSIDLTMLGHAHIDLGYRWDIAETIHRIGPATFEGVLKVMEKEEGFTFCQSQMFLYDAMERHYPDLFHRIRRRVDEGRWEVVGGAWCEYDAILPCGEAVIRQHLQGLRYAADRLGGAAGEVAFVPDSFIGHAATLPQILSGCGIRWYLFGRGLPPGFPRAFRWEGPDGSSLTAYLTFGPYSNPPLTRQHLESLKPYAEAAVGKREIALYGVGDHGGGPRDEDIAALHALRGDPKAPRWRYGTAAAFFRDAFPPETARGLRRRAGSLRGFATGALTSQAQAKRKNRIAEHLLLRTEAIAAVATTLQRKPAHPRVDFSRLWRDLLTLQFHDILPGTSVRSVYRQAEESYAQIRKAASELLDDALQRIRSRIDTTGEGFPLLVVNPGLGSAGQIVEAPLPPWIPRGSRLALRDDAGADVEAECDGAGLGFQADLPALSWRLYRAFPAGKTRPRRKAPSAEPVASLARGGFTLRFDAETGDIGAFEEGGRACASPACALELWEEEEKSTSWVQAFTGRLLPLTLVEPPRIVREDRFRTVVRTVSRSAWSTFAREVTLYESMPFLDVSLRIDWRESDAFLKTRIARGPAAVHASLAHGFQRVEDPEREFCTHDWTDLNDGADGLTVLTDGAFGADCTERGLGISVIRSARDMDPAMAHGEHELRLRLVPYRGAFLPSRCLDAAMGFCAPVSALWDTSHRGGLLGWGTIDNTAPLPPRGAFLSVEGGGARLCAMKLVEEHFAPDAFVIRLRETDGKACRCTVRLPRPCASVWEADHLERPIRELPGQGGPAFEAQLPPFAIRTFLAYL